MINFINIDLVLNNRIIFDNFNLEVGKYEKIVLTGKSGFGKTTIFNLLMGFLKANKGEIIFRGNKLTNKNISAIRQNIAWLPQNPNIIGRGKVKEQILLPFGFSSNKHLLPDDSLLEGELEKLSLDKSILDSSFDQISGGEKQRIGLIICKLLKREVMLLDEPTSALDKENIDSTIHYLCEDGKTTILSASHDENWIKNCDKIVSI